MEDLIHIQKTFEKIVYIDNKISQREFEDCIFKNCDFSNSDFSNNTFMDCEFIDCNLAMTNFTGTSLKRLVLKTVNYLESISTLVLIFYLQFIFRIVFWIIRRLRIKKC